MTVEANKALVRRFIDEVFVAGSEEAVDDLVAEDFVPHNWPGVGPGRQPLKQAQQRIRQGLSDVQMTINDLFGEGDRVAVRLSSHARQTGEFMGMPASGKEYTIEEIHIFRVRDGQIAEHWLQMDRMGMLTELGAIPEPVRTKS